MPELPEVETVVSDLNKKIKNEIIFDFHSEWPKAIKNKKLNVFKKELLGRRIIKARRIGKNIFIDLSGGKTLYIHLKMTGHLLIKNKKEDRKKKNYFDDKVNQYIRHRWLLKTKNSVEKELAFSDLRKFAKIILTDTVKINELPEIKKIGIDALNPSFTLEKFKKILSKRKNKAIGLILMDQELIAGIGNIYRSEILFVAGISPLRKSINLNEKETGNVFKSIRGVLKKAVRLRGTSDSDYRDTSGAPGGFQKVLKVYRRTGKKCQNCSEKIQKMTMGQRSVFYCPKCQK